MATADARNSRRFNISFPYHASGIFHRHARPFSLYPPMPYSQASDHSVTDGLTKTMLLIGTPLVVTCLRNFIHSWRSWRCHIWSLCGLQFFPLVSKWRSQFKKYRAGWDIKTQSLRVSLPEEKQTAWTNYIKEA